MADVNEIVEQIEELSVLEVAELVEKLEDKFGVTAAAPVAMAGAGTSDKNGEAEEKDAYTVVITEVGDNKINVIKAIRKLQPDLGLKEAKEQVDNLPATVGEDVPTEEAEEMKDTLEEAGATIEMQ